MVIYYDKNIPFINFSVGLHVYNMCVKMSEIMQICGILVFFSIRGSVCGGGGGILSPCLIIAKLYFVHYYLTNQSLEVLASVYHVCRTPIPKFVY
jgi:hypothetical protein